MKRTCKQCGREFELSQGEIEFYEAKGLDLPKRCKSCREVNKKDKGKTEATSAKRTAGAQPARRDTMMTGQSFGESGWPLKKLLPTAIVAIVLVLACIIGACAYLGITPGSVDNLNKVSSSIAAKSTGDSTAYTFRTESQLNEHYEKHGRDMGYASAADYQAAASAVATNPSALHKNEKEDNDDVYYLESTNDFVIVSTDGYIRTYFRPDDGKAYFDRQ